MRSASSPKADPSKTASSGDRAGTVLLEAGARLRRGLVWFAVALLASSLAAQRGKREEEVERPPSVDPYTGGRPELMESAGYVSFGPFPWGDRHDTRKIEEVLGGVSLLWVETAHFRIGSGLHEYPRPKDKQEKHKLRAELLRLKARLPAVKERTKALDPWLRLHLVAQRCEELYADFLLRLGLTDADFAERPDGSFEFGFGPYLGQPGKYLVLVPEKKSDWGRYASTFLGADGSRPQRTLFQGSGSLFYGLTPDLLEGEARTDSAVHCLLAHGLAQNLVDGYRAYAVGTPMWFQEGLGHWYARRVDPRWFILGDGSPQRERDRDAWKWEPKIRGRVRNEVFPSFDEMLGWEDRGAVGLTETMMLWSRVDYLLDRAPEGVRVFLDAAKAPLAPGADPRAVMRERGAEAFTAAFGGVAERQAAWGEYVLENYASR